ncbi:flap endonuclease-1 [Candidatus Woesearchaeota archaeon CG10_big_fil_rev_8_21_14_0_10_32_24]|nr:MAG: flap endonuclease-1 [Candidatus Woesearchaeota archaeon CG10_big_fil_rev_8_21_14_0_10_32_24]
MGLKFKDIVEKEEISIKDLRGKILAVDSMNLLYQFLTTIRSVDGSVLTDKHGKVTSHLIGLFNRTTSLMEQGLKLAFVFDGTPPSIKEKTWEIRKAVKHQASLKLKEAEDADDYAEMKKQAGRTAVLTKEMVVDAKNLLTALGVPIIQAPSEGEAQTAYMVAQGKAYASISQDYDNLIFGCPTLIRNLSIEGKRRKTGTLGYVNIKPEVIKLNDVLKTLKINLNQLIVLAILAGTDYNPGGVKGIGPKKGLKLIQEFGEDFDAIFEKVEWNQQYPDLTWKEIFDTIKDIPVTNDFDLEWKKIDEQEIMALLVEKHDFSEDRVKTKLEALKRENKELSQKGLSSFF